ncbi:MAG TPA: polysaccharide biosynthesis tyrosine autokinase [Spirillospora sp.]|nr:polysaccharide biosynthesis tyrosine autokinase [Spirillospora sp.]
MLRALLRWWWLIVLSVSIGVGVGYFLRTGQVDLYFSKAIVMVGQQNNSPIPVGSDRRVLDGYIAFIRRDSLLQPVIDDLGLNVSPQLFQEYMSIEANPFASLLEIGILDIDPERAAIIANRVVDELIRQTSDRATMLDVEFINNQIAAIQQQITNLQAEHDALVEEAANLTTAFAINANLEERRQIESTITGLRTTLLNLVNSAPRSDIQIFERAKPNYFPVAANSILDLLIAGGAGGALSILTILLFTFFDDRLQWDEGRHEVVAGLPILGPLGVIPSNKMPLYVDTMPQSVEAEALRQLRAKLALANGGQQPQVVTIMSYDSGEGKTLTSANLALETARSGLRTLVIDGDMRRGDLHELFHLPNVFGLSDILNSDEDIRALLSQAIVDSGYENLALLTSGRAPADPATLLSRPRLAELVNILKRHYDALVIDAAPTIGGPDAIFLGEVSSGVAIIVNARRTRLASLKRAVEELTSGRHVRIYGVIFNRVRLQVTTKYNSSYYYRQSGSLTAEKLNREMAKPGSGLFALRRHIIIDRNGERLFSIDACAARMGVKRRVVRSWTSSGYLPAERRLLRRWIRESAINRMLEQRTVTVPPEPQYIPEPVNPSMNSVNGSHEIPSHLREQREAILGYAQRPKPDDSEF